MTVVELIEELIDLELAGYGNYRVMVNTDIGSTEEVSDREVYNQKEEVFIY